LVGLSTRSGREKRRSDCPSLPLASQSAWMPEQAGGANGSGCEDI
jgi:hypothetical protein